MVQEVRCYMNYVLLVIQANEQRAFLTKFLPSLTDLVILTAYQNQPFVQ